MFFNKRTLNKACQTNTFRPATRHRASRPFYIHKTSPCLQSLEPENQNKVWPSIILSETITSCLMRVPHCKDTVSKYKPRFYQDMEEQSIRIKLINQLFPILLEALTNQWSRFCTVFCQTDI